MASKALAGEERAGKELNERELAEKELTVKELATQKAELEQALAAVSLDNGETLTIEAMNNIKPSKEVKELYDRMMERYRDETSDT